MEAGCTLLQACFSHVLFSKVLLTEGIGLSFHCFYLNRMAEVETEFEPEQMHYALKCIELQMNRQRRSRWVSLDLDIVRVDGIIVHKDFDKYPFLRILTEDIEQKKNCNL